MPWQRRGELSGLRYRWPCQRCTRYDYCAAWRDRLDSAVATALSEAVREGFPAAYLPDLWVDCGRFSPPSLVRHE